MASIDQNAEAGLSAVMTGGKLTVELVNSFLGMLLDKIKESKNSNNPIIQEAKTEQGKQKLNKLFEKHSEGVIPLADNLTKEELKSYQKEFKKMGVDFSILKNDKDSFSVFFGGKDSASIEKAIENAVEKQSKKIEKKQAKKPMFDTEKLKKKQADIDKNHKTNEPKHEHKKEQTKGAR